MCGRPGHDAAIPSQVVANEKPGFLQRMMQAAEAKRKEMEEAQAKAMKNAKKKR